MKVKRGVCGRPLEGGAITTNHNTRVTSVCTGRKRSQIQRGEFMMGTIQCEMEIDRFTPSRMMGVGDHVL